MGIISINDSSLVSGTLLFSNTTGGVAVYPTTEQCSRDQRLDIERAFNLGRAAAMAAMYDVERGTDSPYGFE